MKSTSKDWKVSAESARKVQMLARHQMILHLLQDIQFDLTVCEIEGWDKTEYIRQLQEAIDHFKV